VNAQRHFCGEDLLLLPSPPLFGSKAGEWLSLGHACDTVKTSCQLSKICMQKEDWYSGMLWCDGGIQPLLVGAVALLPEGHVCQSVPPPSHHGLTIPPVPTAVIGLRM